MMVAYPYQADKESWKAKVKPLIPRYFVSQATFQETTVKKRKDFYWET